MLSIALGMPQHLPPPGTIPGDPAELSSLTCSGAFGDAKKFHNVLAILLISPKKAIMGEMVFGFAMVWLHPYQACISTLDEVAKKLTLLTTPSEN